MDKSDSAPGMPKAVVIEPAFSWGEDRPPKTPWHNTIIYEAHVKGLTVLRQDLPESIRGTFAALADERTVRYLQELGITAIELMPVHQFVDDKLLVCRSRATELLGVQHDRVLRPRSALGRLSVARRARQ